MKKTGSMLVRVFALFCLISAGSSRAWAQTAPGMSADANNPSGAPDPEKLDQIWQVDPLSGQVTITIPFSTTPQGGRGPKIPFKLQYNSGSTLTLQNFGTFFIPNPVYTANNASTALSEFWWSTQPIVPTVSPSGPWVTSGPYFAVNVSTMANGGYTDTNGSYHTDMLGCTVYGPYNYTDEDGASHDLNLEQYRQNDPVSGATLNPSCQSASTSVIWPTSGTSDGSALLTSDGTVVGPDGTVFTGTLPGDTTPYTRHILTDANGNAASISISGGVATAKDALGRTVFVTNLPIGKQGQIPAGSYYVKTYNSSGSSETYTITISTITMNSSGSLNLPHPANSQEACYSGCSNPISIDPPAKNASFPAVTNISLPDGTSAYTFTYDPTYGTVSEIDLPTGGTVRFDWQVRPYSWTPYGVFTAVSDLVVTDVYVSDGATGESHWGYDLISHDPATTGHIIANNSSTVTGPDESYTVYRYTSRINNTNECLNYSEIQSFGSIAKGSCKPAYIASYDANGTLLKTEDTSYTTDGLTARSVETLYDGLQHGGTPVQKQVRFLYDAWDNLTERDESDFYPCSGTPCPIPGTLPAWKRITHTSYAYTTNSALATAHIVNKPSQVIVTDGGGAPASITTYTYDGHGNLTYENHCITILGTGSTATCSVPWQTQNTYDATGQLIQKVEGYGTTVASTTTYTWTGPSGTADSYNGYLTQVAHSNGATDKYVYFAPTGQLKTHTDWNSKVTNYAYDAYFNRLASVTDPQTTDGTTGTAGNGSTNYTYTDTTGAFKVQEQHTITGTTKSSTTKTFDGLGRVGTVTSQVPTTQCSSGTVTVTTSYDSMSRVSSVTNPYCTAGDRTYGTTSFDYDALGRKTKTILADGSTSTIMYGGNATETTDPFNGTATVQHIQQVDALGDLTDVCEVSATALGPDLNPSSCGLNISGTGYLTHYTYNVLGNMENVSQHGQSRTFTYDALSRLTKALNPETGSTPDLYSYSTPSSPCAADPGLPCTKIDTRGVQTTYTYDSMNRLTSKAYSTVAGNTTGSISDLSSCYQYDEALTGSTDTNPKGQLTAEWQQAGACPTSQVSALPSGAVTARIRSNHDAMGRVGEDQQCLLGTTCSTTIGNFLYSYNLAGSPVQSNNGIQASAVPATQIGTNSTAMNAPSVTWMTTYDVAGHVQQAYVQDHPGSAVWPANVFSTDPTLLQPTAFDPFSHVTAARLGIPYGSSTPGITLARQYDVRSRLVSELDYGAGSTSSGTRSLGTITIAGSEQGPTYPASSYATASATISGTGRDDTFNVCPGNPQPCNQAIPDSGTVSITVNGSPFSVTYGLGMTSANIALGLASLIDSSNAPVIATASGSTISLRATIPGTAGNSITISGSSTSTVSWYGNSTSFPINVSSFANGQNVPKTVYDTGTVTATISGVPASVNFDGNSTSQWIASALATAIQNASGSKVTAQSDGDVNVLVSDATGAATDYTVSTNVTYDHTDFTQPSYMALAFAMQDGLASDSTDGLIYYYFVPNGGYAPNGNILAHSDMVTGDWIYAYDAVDRLTSAVAAGNNPSAYTGKIGCWTYDTYGNRKMEAFSSVACANSPTPQISAAYNIANNRVTTASGATFAYDAAGNTLYDGRNNYWYDAEGQLCAVKTVGGAMIQYVYDAEGARVAQGTLTSVPGTPTATCAPPAPNSAGSGLTSSMGLSLTKRYLVDLSGAQVSEFSESSGETWQHSNIWSGGKLVATYDLKGLHFEITDPLGTKRVQANIAGQVDETCTSLPFGNDVNNPMNLWQTSCIPKSNTINTLQTQDDANEHHFTSKERDSESGNDYFEARYYSSAVGRFMSPDWGVKVEPVPYAKLDNPQSLNLYAYVLNNPLTHLDPDGHIDCSGKNAQGVGCQAVAKWNADHDISPTAKKSDFPGVPVKLPNGKTVPDAKSPTGRLMSPTSDLSDAAAKGKDIGATYQAILNSRVPGAKAAALAYLAKALKDAVAQNGDFDYQRTILPGGSLQQLPQFRDVSNFNVGLIGEEAGVPLDTLLGIADTYARMRSSNGQNGLDPQTRQWEINGYQAGASGAYDY